MRSDRVQQHGQCLRNSYILQEERNMMKSLKLCYFQFYISKCQKQESQPQSDHFSQGHEQYTEIIFKNLLQRIKRIVVGLRYIFFLNSEHHDVGHQRDICNRHSEDFFVSFFHVIIASYIFAYVLLGCSNRVVRYNNAAYITHEFTLCSIIIQKTIQISSEVPHSHQHWTHSQSEAKASNLLSFCLYLSFNIDCGAILNDP